MSNKAWRYDEVTYELVGEEIAPLDPRETKARGVDIYIYAANTTPVKPNPARDGYTQVFLPETKEWTYVEDHRGKLYYTENDNYMSLGTEMTAIGPLPEGATLVKPTITLEEAKESVTKDIKNEYMEAADGAYLTSSVRGLVINANQASLINVNSLIGLGATDAAPVMFRVYDNSFVEVTIDELKVFSKEISMANNDLLKQKWAYEEAVASATTVEEVEAIKPAYTYMNFSS